MNARKLASFLLLYIGAVTFLSTGCANNSATSQNAKTATAGFSFAVFGDSRTMMYLPHRSDQRAEAVNYMVDMFELVMPEKVAREAVAKAVKLIYDPASGELVEVVMPFMTKSEVTTLTVDQGWVTEASVEDVKLLPGVRRTMFRLEGGDWVTHELVKAVKGGQADFALHTGDWVWWGKQGAKPSENPYWSRVKDVLLNQLPPPDDRLKSAGLDGRIFSAAGNHEVWEDPNAEGFLSTFGYLKKFGISDKQLIYKFDYNGVRFIFLWTGQYDYREPTAWVATRPAYEEQMKQLRAWLDEAKSAGTKKVFISFHNAVFCRSGMGGLPEAQNPHKLLASYAKGLDIVVFNGHVHTTEVYDVEGVKYLVLGGGGAEQDPILPGRTHIQVPANYPHDQYWKDASPKEEYNYLLVDVRPGEKTKFTLNRFRPWAAKPFETVELYK
jgi:calcineurin-like phosphoesterase family protein